VQLSPTSTKNIVAERSAPNDPVALRVSFNPADGRLRIIPAADQSTEKSLQLWLVPASGNPTSLGVFEPGADGELPIPAELRSRIGQGATLAVSVEPLGGSPTGLPTGPVIASGSARNL
jgi:anti-sigma-K factor RskA